MLSSAIRLQTIMPWEMALLDELEDKPGDTVAVKMAKFDKRQRRQCLALQRELEAEERRKAKEAKRVHKEQEAEAKRIRELEAERKQLEEETRQAQQAGGSSSQQVPRLERPSKGPTGAASTKVVIDVDDGDDEAMEDTPDVETVSHPRVLRTLLPRKDSMAEVLNRRLGEVMRLLQKNNTAIETLARDVWDLSGVLEESFKALKTMTMALVSQAQNADDV
ncbi:hypothetical protein PISMIDRAFT_11326 [Pisolithus microcarpus 441]|uniref:Uncharacterized protein n=1 Tax=Pisolithus microcarpus 441 TaxID=765257 RepID=A0A0C9YDI3_9AGAM|nr:hypothetical protein PISMIDRAFT_11326 [Pisolithus microcarpus 441]